MDNTNIISEIGKTEYRWMDERYELAVLVRPEDLNDVAKRVNTIVEGQNYTAELDEYHVDLVFETGAKIRFIPVDDVPQFKMNTAGLRFTDIIVDHRLSQYANIGGQGFRNLVSWCMCRLRSMSKHYVRLIVV